MTFDPPDYPRTYKVPTRRRFYALLLALFLGIPGWYISRALGYSGFEMAYHGCMGLLFLFGGAGLLLHSFLSSVTLTAGAMKVRGLFGHKTLARGDIRGYYYFNPAHKDSDVFLVMNDGREVQVPSLVDKDAAFRSWIETLENLGARK